MGNVFINVCISRRTEHQYSCWPCASSSGISSALAHRCRYLSARMSAPALPAVPLDKTSVVLPKLVRRHGVLSGRPPAAQACYQVPHEPLVGRPAALCRRAAPGSPSVRRTGRSKVVGLPALTDSPCQCNTPPCRLRRPPPSRLSSVVRCIPRKLLAFEIFLVGEFA